MNAEAYATESQLTPQDLERGRLYLQQTRDYIQGAADNLSSAQAEFKPAPDRWSIAEIVEHMAMTQDFILDTIWPQLLQAPPPPAEQNQEHVDAIAVNQMPVRLNKFKAPEMLHPTGQAALPDSLRRLLCGYKRLAGMLEITPDLRQHAFPSRPLKAITNGAYECMDGYQWLLTMAAHVERHTKQILEVKASPQFPASA